MKHFLVLQTGITALIALTPLSSPAAGPYAYTPTHHRPSAPPSKEERRGRQLLSQCNSGSPADGWGWGQEPGRAGFRCADTTMITGYWDCARWVRCR